MTRVVRAMFELRVRPERLAAYRAAHAAVSRDMLEALRDAGWRNYSIFEGDDGRMFGYFEADDVDEAQRLVGETEANARWQETMAENFAEPGSPGSAPTRFLTEVFNLDDQLDRTTARDPRTTQEDPE